MSTRVGCGRCGASILARTKDSTGGLCARCFKNDHFEMLPAQVRQLAERGLSDFLIRWKEFLKLPLPIGPTATEDAKLRHNLPVVAASISGALRSGYHNETPASAKLLEELSELRTPDAEKYIETLQSFFRELDERLRCVPNKTIEPTR